MTSFNFLLAAIALTVTFMATTTSALQADSGNWTVGDCILAQFKLEFAIDVSNGTDLNTTQTVAVPPHAQADVDQTKCGAERQLLSLMWTDTTKNGTVVDRNVTIVFERVNVNETGVTEEMYGVRRVFAYIQLGHFQDINSKNETINVTSYLDVDTGVSNPVMFKLPISRSFLCNDVGDLKVDTHLHFTYVGAPTQGTFMPNATKVSAKDVHLDAFRTKDAPKHGFQVPVDCDFRPNDIVPIAVGVALALLVIIVLVAYMIGRRKRRQRGYQSV